MYAFNKLKSALTVPKVNAILGFSLGGSSESSSFSEKSEQDITKDETSRTSKTGTTTGTVDLTQQTSATDTTRQTATGLEESAISLLDEETQALLSGLLTDLAAGGSSAELIAELNERALTAEDTLGGLVDPIVANARSNLEEELGQSIQSLSRSAGSSQNSLVQQLGLQEATNVEREIADLAATLGFSVQQATTEQQQGAVGATENIVAQLGDLLKGATQTGTTATTETTEAVRQLEELLSSQQETLERVNLREVTDLQSLISAIENTTGSGRTKGASAGLSFGI